MSSKIDPFDSVAEKIGPYTRPATDLQDDFRSMQPAIDAVASKPGRLPWDHYFLKLADLVATRATCDRAHMGCILVRDNNIIATGYNGSIKGLAHCNEWTHFLERDPEHWSVFCAGCGVKGTRAEVANIPCTKPVDRGAGHLMEEGHCVRTVHAEQNALAQSAKLGKATLAATAYINGYPCWRCFMLLANAGITRIVYSKAYRNDPKVADAAKNANIILDHVEV